MPEICSYPSSSRLCLRDNPCLQYTFGKITNTSFRARAFFGMPVQAYHELIFVVTNCLCNLAMRGCFKSSIINRIIAFNRVTPSNF